MKRIAAAFVAIFMLSGCEAGQGNSELWGTLIGAGLGVALGSTANHHDRAALMTMGGIMGAAAGNAVGRKLDEADRIKMTNARNRALESNRSYDTAGWYNPDTGTQGWVRPQPAYRDNSGQQCRKFDQTIVIDGKQERVSGTACRQPDGTWITQ